jgi:DNA-binding transcriptional LysR family regulator
MRRAERCRALSSGADPNTSARRRSLSTAKSPDGQIEMTNSGSVVDMHVSGAELDFRLGPLNDSELIARPLGTFKFGVFAAPSSRSRHGTPAHPRELSAYRTLAHKSPRSATISSWD